MGRARAQTKERNVLQNPHIGRWTGYILARKSLANLKRDILGRRLQPLLRPFMRFINRGWILKWHVSFPVPRLKGKKWKEWQNLFSWTPKSLQTLTAAMKLKDACSLKESYDKPAAAAKSLQSCLTLCNPIDSSPPGCPIPGNLQAWQT